MKRVAFQRQVGSDFSDHRRKLEAVTGKASAQNQVWMFGMTIDNKMLVGREGIHAGLRLSQRAEGTGHPFLE